MTDKQCRIQALIQSIVTYLQAHRAATRGVDLTLDKLASMDLSEERIIDLPPKGTRHDEVLNNAIAGIVAPELCEIAGCLKAAKDDLVWREDNAQFYPPGTDLGEGYTKCNLHTLLIGARRMWASTIPISALAFSCWVHGRCIGIITTMRQSFI